MWHWIASFMGPPLLNRWLKVNKSKFLALFVVLTRTNLTTFFRLTVRIFQAPVAEFEVATFRIPRVLRIVDVAKTMRLALAHVAYWVSDLACTGATAIVVREALSVTESIIDSVLIEIGIILVSWLVIFWHTLCPKSMIIYSIGFVVVWLRQIPNAMQRLVQVPVKSPCPVFVGNLSSCTRDHHCCQYCCLNRLLHFYKY